MRNVQVVVSMVAALASACAGTIDDPSQFQVGSSSASTTRNVGRSEAPEDEAAEPRAAADSATEPLEAGAREPRAWDAGAPGAPLDSAVGAATDRWPVDANVPEAATLDRGEAGLSDAARAAADAGGAADAGAACDFRGLIAAKCGSAGCHGAGAVSSGLDLGSDNLAARLAGRKAGGACASYLLIDPEQPEQSALYRKVTADACGSRMPLGGTLTDQEQLCILQWITNL